jgi:cysteine-rich repeat protein
MSAYQLDDEHDDHCGADHDYIGCDDHHYDLGRGVCGDGIVEGGEDCDPGTAFTFGDGCSDGCTRVDCGDPDNNGAVSAGDALFVLKVAVGLASCDNCVCNVDSVGESTTASDAFRTLRSAIGLPDELICPPCQ